METDERDWVMRGSARLHAQWPRICREQRDEVAVELWHDPQWRQSEPEHAVAEWRKQGLPDRSSSG